MSLLALLLCSKKSSGFELRFYCGFLQVENLFLPTWNIWQWDLIIVQNNWYFFLESLVVESFYALTTANKIHCTGLTAEVSALGVLKYIQRYKDWLVNL